MKKYYFGILSLFLFFLIYITSHMLSNTLNETYGEKLNKMYFSKNKNLSIDIQKECSTASASGRYYFLKNTPRFQGMLTRVNCSQDIDSEKLEFNFTDSEGSEMCYGEMTKIESVKKNITIWKIEGSVSDHHCSQIGKIIEFEMEKGRKSL
jgi:hypothetical protein